MFKQYNQWKLNKQEKKNSINELDKIFKEFRSNFSLKQTLKGYEKTFDFIEPFPNDLIYNQKYNHIINEYFDIIVRYMNDTYVNDSYVKLKFENCYIEFRPYSIFNRTEKNYVNIRLSINNDWTIICINKSNIKECNAFYMTCYHEYECCCNDNTEHDRALKLCELYTKYHLTEN